MKLFALVTFSAAYLWAFAASSVLEMIKDASGAVILYSFPALPDGYDLTIETNGVETQEKRNIAVDTDAALCVDASRRNSDAGGDGDEALHGAQLISENTLVVMDRARASFAVHSFSSAGWFRLYTRMLMAKRLTTMRALSHGSCCRSTTRSAVLSRLLVIILGLLVWCCLYLDAWLAYHLPRGSRRMFSRLMAVGGGVCFVVIQIRIVEHLAPHDAHGNFFLRFVMIEFGGGLVVLCWMLLRDRRRTPK